MVEERHNPDTQGNWGNWKSCLRYLEIYASEKTTLQISHQNGYKVSSPILIMLKRTHIKKESKPAKRVSMGFLKTPRYHTLIS